MKKIIQQGAEAIIYLDNNLIIKDRISKKYRINQLDNKIRKQRTKAETKILEKASLLINSPLPIKSNEEYKIIMPYIKGKKLSDHLDKLSKSISKNVCINIGKSIAKLHDNNIIHGDLTTSNMILDEKKQVWFIDFGLAYHSERHEDKAVDIHLIKQALEAKHFKNYDFYWKNIEKGYSNSKNFQKTLDQLKKVESRGRYKEKY